MGEYIPQAGSDNSELPGLGGIYNQVNFQVYHYGGNNPVKYVDPDGRVIEWEKADNVSDEDFQKAKDMGENIKNSDTEAGARWRAAEASDRVVTIEVSNDIWDNNIAVPGNDDKLGFFDKIKSGLGIGGNAFIRFDPDDSNNLRDGAKGIPEATLAHEMAHAYLMMAGRNPWTRKGREMDATAVENQYRYSMNIILQPNEKKIREFYGYGSRDYNWAVPQYNGDGTYSIFGTGKSYKLRKVR